MKVPAILCTPGSTLSQRQPHGKALSVLQLNWRERCQAGEEKYTQHQI